MNFLPVKFIIRVFSKFFQHDKKFFFGSFSFSYSFLLVLLFNVNHSSFSMSTTPHPSQCLPLLLLNVYHSLFLMSSTPHPSQSLPLLLLNVYHCSSFSMSSTTKMAKFDLKPMSGCDACRLHPLCRLLNWRAVAPQVRFAGNFKF